MFPPVRPRASVRDGQTAFYRHLHRVSPGLDGPMLPGTARHEIAKAAAAYGQRCVRLARGRRLIAMVPAGPRARGCR